MTSKMIPSAPTRPAGRFPLASAADPGFTATEFNGYRGTQNIIEGTDAIVEMATIGPEGPTGTFVDRHGRVGW